MKFSRSTFYAESNGRVRKIFDMKKKMSSEKNLEFWDIFLKNGMYTVFYQRK